MKGSVLLFTQMGSMFVCYSIVCCCYRQQHCIERLRVQLKFENNVLSFMLWAPKQWIFRFYENIQGSWGVDHAAATKTRFNGINICIYPIQSQRQLTQMSSTIWKSNRVILALRVKVWGRRKSMNSVLFVSLFQRTWVSDSEKNHSPSFAMIHFLSSLLWLSQY